MAFMDYMPQFGQNIPNQTVGAQDDATAQLLLKRRLAQADALRNAEMPQGQMVSGHYVAPSWTQYLGNLANKWVSGQQENEAMREYMGFQKTEREKQAEALRNLGRDISPVAETQQGSYDIQVPNGQTPTPADKVGAMQPYESGYKTISVPMTTETGKMRPRTQDEINQAIANYTTTTRNPALMEKVVMNQVESALAPKQYDWKEANGILYQVDKTGKATGVTMGEAQKVNLQREYEYAQKIGYKGGIADFLRLKTNFLTPAQAADIDWKMPPPSSGGQKNAKGWVLHTDAQGNKAYVNPNNPNEYEETK